MKALGSVATLVALCMLVGCPDKPGGTPAQPAEVTLESGPLASDASAGSLRVARGDSPEASSLAWVTGYRAEAVGVGAADEWHSDLRLKNGTRLLAATSRTPALRFPEGFALPLGQILADIPEAWRGVRMVTGAPATSTVDGIRWRVESLPREVSVANRLYVVALALTEETPDAGMRPPNADSAPSIEESARRHADVLLSPLPGSTWPVPTGKHEFRRRLASIVSVEATVHAALAHVGPHARSIRFTDVTDGKLLWEPAVSNPGSLEARVDAYASASGFAVHPEHEYEIEAVYENPDDQPSTGSAVLFLYYRPPANELLRYSFPPEDEDGDGNSP